MAEDFVELDVRPILRDGGEPFGKIMEVVGALKPGQGLRLLATFKPVPLFSVLGKKGFGHEEHEIGGGDWEILFRPGAGAAAQAAASPARPAPVSEAVSGNWPAPVEEMDNRDLEPPEPMVRILAALEEMQPGQVLSALLCREPSFLLTELAQRGHAWRGGFEPDGKTYKINILVRIGKQKTQG